MLVCVQDGGPRLVLYVQAYGADLVFYCSVLRWRCWLCVLLVNGAGLMFCWGAQNGGAGFDMVVVLWMVVLAFRMAVLALCSAG